MTLEEKASILRSICNLQNECENCPIKNVFPEYNCGNGYYWYDVSETFCVPEDEINKICEFLENVAEGRMNEISGYMRRRIVENMNTILKQQAEDISGYKYYDSSWKNSIIKVDIIVPNKVVKVTFVDGDEQKAVCQEPDEFSLEMAISICLTKHLLGSTNAYNKAIKNGVKVYEKQLVNQKLAEEEEARIEKRHAKKAAYMKRRAEKKREEQIEMQKEAYIRALEAVNNK